MSLIKKIFGTPPDVGELHMGDLLGLWDITRNKIIGLPIAAIYYRQAKDNELKDLIKNGTDFFQTTQIYKIQKLLHNKGFEFPTELNWEKKFEEPSEFVIPNFMIDDEEIAISIREGTRLTISLEGEALRNCTDEGVRKLLSEMLEDDNMAYSGILALQRKKGWSDFPPSLLH